MEQQKYLESTDCSGVERLPISKNQNKKDEQVEKPPVPKIFEHISEYENDSVQTIDRVDDNDKSNNKKSKHEEDEGESPMEIDNKIESTNELKVSVQDQEVIKTLGPKRGGDQMIMGDISRPMKDAENFADQKMPTNLETYYRSETRNTKHNDTNLTEWLNLCGQTRNLSASLTEQLRLILEPTRATKFRGDFRTGKRLNMRKIIPYIASGFRKDRIWLRRTKPSAREYQVIVALDDSSSMRDNAVRNTAHKSLAIICQALSTLDVGKFGILGFGNQAKMIQPLQSNFSPEDGSHLLDTFTFEQTATHVAEMLAMARKAFANCAAGSSSRSITFERLLIIISDGRNIFNEGKDKVIESVRRARLENIFVIFLIVENMGTVEENGDKPNDSILDIRLASFDSSGLPTIVPYMEEFPFSHYVILR